MILINAKIYALSNIEIIENGFIEITNDIITNIGNMSNYKITGDEIDLKNKFITPGFIDAHCHIGIFEDSLGFEGDDANEDTDPTTPQLRAIDAINPFDICFSEALFAGVTTVVSSPGSANPISGQMVALKTYEKTIENMILKQPLAMKFAFGENPKTVYHSKNLSPVTRMATASIIREQLFITQRYRDDIIKSQKDNLGLPDLSMKNEAMLDVINRKIPVHAHAHRADDILTAIRIAKEFSLDLTIIHGTDAQLILDELKDSNTPVLFGPTLCDRSKPELKNLSFKTIAKLYENDVLTAIITDHPVIPIQYLPVCAALAVKEGLSYINALKAITINAAKICKLDKQIGSLEIGKIADIIVFDNEPLNIFSKVEFVICSGKIIRKQEL